METPIRIKGTVRGFAGQKGLVYTDQEILPFLREQVHGYIRNGMILEIELINNKLIAVHGIDSDKKIILGPKEKRFKPQI